MRYSFHIFLIKKDQYFKNKFLLRHCHPNSTTAPHFAFNSTLSDVNNGCRVTVKDFTPCKRIRIAESERFLLVESGIQLKQSGIQLTIGIRNPSSTGKVRNLVPGIWNPLRGIQNPRLSWIPLHGVEDSSEKGTA